MLNSYYTIKAFDARCLTLLFMMRGSFTEFYFLSFAKMFLFMCFLFARSAQKLFFFVLYPILFFLVLSAYTFCHCLLLKFRNDST